MTITCIAATSCPVAQTREIIHQDVQYLCGTTSVTMFLYLCVIFV